LREWASGLDVTPKRLANILLLRAVLKDTAADEIIDRNVLHGWKPDAAIGLLSAQEPPRNEVADSRRPLAGRSQGQNKIVAK
jgi:hypothetical protein